MQNRRRGLFAVVLAGALVTVACSSGADRTDIAASPAPSPSSRPTATVDPTGFHQEMRALWEDHVAWTRLFIVSAVAGSPNTDATLARLLQNQTDIGNAVAEFYGADAGTKLTTLLNGHIATAGDILTAAKAHDDPGVTKASAAWYANADEIAAFLASANPAWPEAALKDMMHAHLDQTLAEATAELTGDYPKSVSEYDHIVTHILDMADALSSGIVTQFPDKFTS